jgi:hypothetical protein
MKVTTLFDGKDIVALGADQEQRIRNYIERLARDVILNSSEHDLITAIFEEFKFRVPVLRENERHLADASETQIDVRNDPQRMVPNRLVACLVPGVRHVFAVPFDGDAGLFRIRPMVWGGGHPPAAVEGTELHFVYTGTNYDAEALNRNNLQDVARIRDTLRSLAESADQINEKLRRLTESEVKKRKAHLLSLANMTAALNLPLKRRDGQPTTYAVPLQPRRPRIEELKAHAVPFKPEPALSDEDYENILRIMQSMVHVMERSPRAFSQLQEEDLRTHFLIQLNGQYEGFATGETFNFKGKTDIYIPFEGNAVFIAECKFWNGEKVFLETIDQLLSYLSWRDTKTAILIFNRNKNFSPVLEQISKATPTHPHYKRTVSSSETVFRYVFGQPNDTNREVIVTILAFNVPVLT